MFIVIILIVGGSCLWIGIKIGNGSHDDPVQNSDEEAGIGEGYEDGVGEYVGEEGENIGGGGQVPGASQQSPRVGDGVPEDLDWADEAEN